MLAIVLAWLTSNLTEVVGFVTGLAAVLLAARRIIWNFPVGIANNVFFFVLFVHSSLYADAWASGGVRPAERLGLGDLVTSTGR